MTTDKSALTQAEHTPGPWDAEFEEAVFVRDSERGRVCTINWLRGPHGAFGRKTDSEGAANARLIAAAPDLLRELRGAPCPGGGYSGQPRDEYADVQNCLKAGVCGCSLGAAIAKAEGSSQ